MVLHKTYRHNWSDSPGFTLMEVLLVLALLSIIASATLFFSSSYYQSKSFMSERDTLISAFTAARTHAMSNKYGVVHGVAINPPGFVGYVVFAGNDFTSSDLSTQTKFASSYAVSFDVSTPEEIIFSQLSGDSSFVGDIKLFDVSRANASTSILINSEGAFY